VIVPGMVGRIVTTVDVQAARRASNPWKLVTSQTCGKFITNFLIVPSCSMISKGYHRRLDAHSAVPSSFYVPNMLSTCKLEPVLL
jgi:hypothetical protein